MEQIIAVSFLIFALLALLGLGVWVGLSLLATGMVAMLLFTDMNFGDAMATTIWSHSATWSLTSLPLFIWMGEILFRSKLSENLFSGLSPWLRRLPGGLLHVNILGCATFAALSGSSAATLTTVGKMTIPELKKHSYPASLALGSLAGAGTVGLLIPPSITLIVYGVTVEESIGRLFIAGIIPGLMLSLMFSSYVFGWGLLTPEGRSLREARATMAEKIRGLAHLLPVMILIGSVIGSIFFGIASPIEAAAVGVVGALVLSYFQGSLSVKTLVRSLDGTVQVMSMIMLLIAGSSFLALSMAFTGLPAELAGWIGRMNLSPTMLIAVLTLFFLFLGMFLDGFSMILLTMAILEPVVRSAGIDMIWFGVFIVLISEMALLTPPIGFNLFLVDAMSGAGIAKVSKAAFPMFLIMLLAVALLVLFPWLALWLPELMTG
ncbi:MAG: TRAP transporter large permease subunit [Gammaproteobacteria bacterium]|nr:TRAP transporter large permease subunit [Gammaproteobacteria bacterium]MDE0283367.1 TRAP transporter large permease subunit [Gammaproteobacteria bacterium]